MWKAPDNLWIAVVSQMLFILHCAFFRIVTRH